MLIRKKALILSTAAMLLLGLANGSNSYEEATTDLQHRALSSSKLKDDTGYDSDGEDSNDDEETQAPRYSIDEIQSRYSWFLTNYRGQEIHQFLELVLSMGDSAAMRELQERI